MASRIAHRYSQMSSEAKIAIKILIADKDPSFLDSISNAPSIIQEGWQLRTLQDGEEAAASLAEDQADIVLTSLDLPKTSGDILLSNVKREYPNSLRFLVHDQSDKESLKKGTGLAHLYIERPISPEDLVTEIKHVFNTQLRIRRKEVIEIVRDTKQLHVNTEPMQQLLKTSDDPNCGIDDFAPVIRQHPTVVATILQVANTAFLGAGGRVETIEEALQILGMDFVRNLAITELAKKQLSLSPGLQEIANAVLKHCIETSHCGLQLGKFGVNVKQTQALSSITLLHDLGKLVLLANKQEEYADLMGRSIENNRPLWHLEQAIFGCDHAAIGGLLFAMWGLPENIVRATTWHHEPAAFASNEFCYVTLLHFANSAAHVIHEMPFYCGDELIPEVAAKARLPIEYVQELD